MEKKTPKRGSDQTLARMIAANDYHGRRRATQAAVRRSLDLLMRELERSK